MMRRPAAWGLGLLLLLLLAGACAAPAPKTPAPPPAEPVTITVVSTTDIHGDVVVDRQKDKGGEELTRGGLALVGGFLDNLRQALGDRVLLLDGGDTWQGTLISSHTKGRAVVAAMNALGYHAAALGNHEFDWGREVMLARAKEMHFPMLAANMVVEATGQPPDWHNVLPWTMVERVGVKVGVLGLATIDTPVFQRAGVLDDLEFRPLAETVLEWVPRLRQAGAQVVVALVHEGGECESADDPHDLSSCKPDTALFRMVRALPPGTVDLVVGGHTHHVGAHLVNGTPVIQAGAKARWIVRADLVWDPGTGRVDGSRTKIHRPVRVCGRHYQDTGRCKPGKGKGPVVAATYEGRPVVEHAAAAAALAPFEAEVAAALDKPIGADAATTLIRNPLGESELGNLIADAMRAAVPDARVGLQNSGGIRADVNAGPITYGELYDVLPFGNKLARVQVTGAQLETLLRLGARGRHGPTQVSGLRLVVDASKVGCPGEEYLVSATLDDGAPLVAGESYVVATSDYLAGGGGGWSAVTGGLPEGGVTVLRTRLLRDAVADHLRRLGGAVDTAERPLLDAKRPRIEVLNRDKPKRCGAP